MNREEYIKHNERNRTVYKNTSDWKQYYYSEVWRDKSSNTKALTKYRCALFWWKRADHSHHMTYRNFEHELAFRDLVPLSSVAHSLIHTPFLWGSKKKNYVPRIIVNVCLRFMFVCCVLFTFLFVKNKPKKKLMIRIKPDKITVQTIGSKNLLNSFNWDEFIEDIRHRNSK